MKCNAQRFIFFLYMFRCRFQNSTKSWNIVTTLGTLLNQKIQTSVNQIKILIKLQQPQMKQSFYHCCTANKSALKIYSICKTIYNELQNMVTCMRFEGQYAEKFDELKLCFSFNTLQYLWTLLSLLHFWNPFDICHKMGY